MLEYPPALAITGESDMNTAPAPYPISTPGVPRVTPEQCNIVQAVALCAGIDYALTHQ